VLLLADIEEMKYQEVADALSIPMGTVMSRLARARKQVRDYILQPTGGKPGDVNGGTRLPGMWMTNCLRQSNRSSPPI